MGHVASPLSSSRRAVSTAALVLAALAMPAAAADRAPPAGPCMETTRTVSGSYAVLNFAGFLLSGGTWEEIPVGSGRTCRGAAGDINACWHDGRVYPPGAVATFEGPRGLPLARVCRLGIWD